MNIDDGWRKATDWPGGGNGWGKGPAGWGGGFAGGHRGGPPPWVADLVRSFGGPEVGQRRGPKARRGDVRAAILDVLATEPMNGYQLIQQIAERSEGAWKPSPGSVYPTIQQLEDEGLVVGVDDSGRRLLDLTEAGREYVAEHTDELAATWQSFALPAEEERPTGTGDLMPVIGQTMSAVWQVTVSGTDQQRAEAAEILGETRKKLYGLLADGDPQ